MGWKRFAETHCKQCDVCSRVHRGKPPRQGRLQPLEANGPLDRLHIDLCGPFPRSDGKAWIMTCLDAYTRFLIAVPLRDKSAVTVAEALFRHVFCVVGLSRQMISDLGPEFQNDIFRHLCRLLHVNQLRTTSYRPNCNGRIERVHRSLNSLMAKVVGETQRDWTQHLAPCVLAYNMSRHEATSFSPFYLMHGREAICPLDLLIETPVEAMPPDGNRYAEQLVERLKVAFAAVNRHTTAQVERMKRRYDANVRVQEFRLHQLVLYYYPRRF